MTSARRRNLEWAVASGLMVIVAGCASAEMSADVSESTKSETTPCTEATQEHTEEVIESQSTALKDRDFESAYLFASPSFRAAVDLDDFERVISRQYEMLLYAEELSVGACEVVDDALAQVTVEVVSRFHQPTVLVYTMVFTDGQWWVSAVENSMILVPNT